MFDTSKVYDQRVTNEITNVFKVPDKYDVYHHNKNDDIDRLKFYIENSESLSDYTIWMDILYPITKQIGEKVSNYITKYYKGEQHLLKIEVNDPEYSVALSMPKTSSSLKVIGDTIRDMFNINNNVMINHNIFAGDYTIAIFLYDRISE
jgi:hypothetical protein